MLSAQEFSDDFIDVGLPNGSHDMEKVNRKVRVDYIGDTNGSYPGFLFNTKKLGLIDESGDWIGGKRRLVILGDVFGDRNTESFQIALHVNKLIDQGAPIDCLAGNHDDEALGYFDQFPNGRQYVGLSYLRGHFLRGSTEYIDIFRGIQEFAEFGENFQGHLSWQKVLIQNNPQDILSEMRRVSKGLNILRYLYNMQVGKLIDDTLFIHTDPVDAMVNMMRRYDWDIEKINTVFRSFLLQTLMRGDLSDSETIRNPLILNIRTTFLDHFNRRYDTLGKPMFSERKAKILREELGIQRIIHGHTNHANERPPQPQTIYRGGIGITSADNSSFKRGDIYPGNTHISAGAILQNGHRIEPKKHQ